MAAGIVVLGILWRAVLGGGLTENGSRRSVGVELPTMPVAVTSFAAAAINGELYYYGGNRGVVHDYHRDSQSGSLYRLEARPEGAWRTLAGDLAVQGVAMVSHREALYRVGGLQALNDRGAAPELHSTRTFARYDPRSNQWARLADLPEGLSSHDAWVLDGKLYVLGGWTLTGSTATARWRTHGWVFDLNDAQSTWRALPEQGFKRRALTVAATSKRLYVIGGTTPAGVTNRVDVFDPATNQWSNGPDLAISDPMAAFGGSAVGIGDDLFFSGFSGRVYRLHEGDESWTDTGVDLKTPRFFHRMVDLGDGRIAALGGAGREGILAGAQALDVATLLSASPTATKSPFPKFPAVSR